MTSQRKLVSGWGLLKWETSHSSSLIGVERLKNVVASGNNAYIADTCNCLMPSHACICGLNYDTTQQGNWMKPNTVYVTTTNLVFVLIGRGDTRRYFALSYCYMFCAIYWVFKFGYTSYSGVAIYTICVLTNILIRPSKRRWKTKSTNSEREP